ncbi:zinc-dependent alcohol dehydrogenase family protein [Sphingomonas sp. Leaf37]|uniref:zinc-dependent alcohol dehydrogenase family protein n=1 Tax=Sphingomonas sp. Leaf37 TaxID=2876552 RepID=UPI001E5F0116|nr:zinc-dependent alcohol dehydrogenase family protein [Sphingomonas sp. Leaf37]
MKAIQISAFGEPRDVLRWADFPEPPAPALNEVLVQLEASPFNPHDIYVIKGGFPVLPTVPGPVGNEGVGRVIGLGENVNHLAIGDRVLLPTFTWLWRERMTVSAAGLFALPEADLHQLSMLGINPPTAALLLSEYTTLEPGDWVVQNAANSGVGRAVISIAKARGYKTLNIVRRPELVDELQAAGADVVLVTSDGTKAEAEKAVDGGRIGLGIDSVGGKAIGVLADIVSPRAAIVAYSILDSATMSIPAWSPIFKQVTVHGFFLGNPDSAAAAPAAVRDVLPLVVNGALHTPVSGVYPPSAIVEAAIHAERGGKVILDFTAE